MNFKNNGFFVILLFLLSCEKEYTCRCWYEGNHPDTTFYEEVVYKNISNHSAEGNCHRLGSSEKYLKDSIKTKDCMVLVNFK
jgi:hypothetical protein